MAPYDATRAQPPMVFPLSGPPVCVAFGAPSHQGLMCTVHDEKTGANFMELNDVVHNATTLEKFCLEPSKKHKGLLHVKCCANNKYWVAQPLRADRNSPWFIHSVADEPEENLHKPSCTLFDFRPDDNGSSVRIFHPQQNKYASVFYMSGTTRGKTYLKLRDDQGDGNPMNVFIVRRLSQQKQLPRYVAFRGCNGKYLTQKDRYLQFSSSEITDPAVVHETFTDEYGVIRIRTNGSGKFWRLRENGWISADSSDAVYNTDHIYRDADTLFKMVIKDDNYIALQSISNDKFCKSLSDQGAECLSASTDNTDTRETTLMFEEPIRDREVYGVQYRLSGKKRAMNEAISRQEVRAINRTKNTHTAKVRSIMYERKERSWNADVKASAGIKTHFTASLPLWIFDLEGGVESHLEIEGQYDWGETNLSETMSDRAPSYPVPPMTQVICSVASREVVVDVPYSYKQKETLYNGEILPPREFHDGIYRSVTSSDIHISTKEEPLK